MSTNQQLDEHLPEELAPRPRLHVLTSSIHKTLVPESEQERQKKPHASDCSQPCSCFWRRRADWDLNFTGCRVGGDPDAAKRRLTKPACHSARPKVGLDPDSLTDVWRERWSCSFLQPPFSSNAPLQRPFRIKAYF